MGSSPWGCKKLDMTERLLLSLLLFKLFISILTVYFGVFFKEIFQRDIFNMLYKLTMFSYIFILSYPSCILAWHYSHSSWLCPMLNIVSNFLFSHCLFTLWQHFISSSKISHSIFHVLYLCCRIYNFSNCVFQLLVPHLVVTCCCSVAQACSTLWDFMDCSTPGFPV